MSASKTFDKSSKDDENQWGPEEYHTEAVKLVKKTTIGAEIDDSITVSPNKSDLASPEFSKLPRMSKRVPVYRHSVLAPPGHQIVENIRRLSREAEDYNPNQPLPVLPNQGVVSNVPEGHLSDHNLQVDSSDESDEELEVQEAFGENNSSDIDRTQLLEKFFTCALMITDRMSERRSIEIKRITKKAAEVLTELTLVRESQLDDEAKLLMQLHDHMTQEMHMLDRIETMHISIYSGIARQRLRIINQDHEVYKRRYGAEAFNVPEICFKLLARNSGALGYEDEKLKLTVATLAFVLRCLEYGFIPMNRMRDLLLSLFQKTEAINKQEEYITKNPHEFRTDTFQKLMECKSLASGILLQIVTCVNDDWVYHYTKAGKVDELVGSKQEENKLLSFLKKKAGPQQAKEYAPFVCDLKCYSLFSFIMFNYLLKELRKDNQLFTNDMYLKCMKDLVSYVYELKEDPFVLSMQLLKPEYLNYYIGLNIEDDHINRANEILKLIEALKRNLNTRLGTDQQNPEEFEELEQDIGNIFGMLEILMGLQDETYNIRLMLTEKKVPELLVDIFVKMQENYIGESGDELIIQGLKVLYQLCRGNYTGQALITKGKSWSIFKRLIKGPFSVFNILFLKQLFEQDQKYLHINQEFAIELIDLFNEKFDLFFNSFTQANPINNAKDLVSLYAFKSLIALFIKTHDIPYNIRRSYNLPISSKLHSMVENFAFPLFKENYLHIDQIYEPKLLTKNWKLEDGSFLFSLMMLSGDHIKCMMVDFAYSLINLYNKSCENYFPSAFFNGMYRSLPLNMTCFDYLMTFTEGIKFKTEIMNSYSIFRVFSQSSKIPETYSPSELSLDGRDTNLDFLPDNHMEELPDMIVAELAKFEIVHKQRERFVKEDIVEYLLKGLCQMCYKFAMGVLWYLLASEKEEFKAHLTSRVVKMSDKILGLMDLVLEDNLKPTDGQPPSKAAVMLQQMTKDQQSGITNKLKDSLETILKSIEQMLKVAGTQYQNILKKYELNIGYTDFSSLKIAKSLLKSEASFNDAYKARKKKEKNEEDDDLADLNTNVELSTLNGLINNYKAIKKGFLEDRSKNKFYDVLQSKMENTNQANLVSYVCNSLASVDHRVCEYNSLWFSKMHINTIVFFNNTMYWCPKTRTKLYEYLHTHPKMKQKIIATIYKGLRDCFTILAYGPFMNEQWELMFSKYFILTSFIKGLCKQNCQEFKIFLGEFKPDLHCKNHLELESTVLGDIVNVFLKFINFSGISFNKEANEYPSDRLGTILLTESMLRCIIDMLTGPCKPNQKAIYNKGIMVWLNMLSRVITDLDSHYYVLMNMVLDYLLSLIEGNSSEVLKSFATSFDIPVLYSVMTKLLTMLWRRVIKMRKKEDLRKALKKVKEEKDKEKKPISGKSEAMAGSKDSLRSREALKHLEDNVEMHAIDSMKIDSWSDLIYMYMNGDFKENPALSCSIKIFIFLSRVSYKSKKYQIFFDIKEAALNEQYRLASYSEEEIRLNQGSLKDKTTAGEDLIVYYFMNKITARVEIKEANHNFEIVIFPKPPMCFFLREATMTNFIETRNIENTEAKIIDMFESFEQFYLEMQSHQKFKSTYRVIGKFATDKSFKYLRVICYFLSVAINLTLLYDIEFKDGRVLQHSSYLPVLLLTVFLDLLSVLSIGLWLMANFKVAWIESYRKFQVKHPYRNPYQPQNLLVILLEVFLRKDIINFYVHFFIATVGVSYSVLVQVRSID